MGIKKIIKRLICEKKRKYINSSGINFNVSPSVEIIGGKYMNIGNDFSMGKYSKLQVWDSYNGISTNINPNLQIGRQVSMMSNCHISCANKIVIEDGVLMGDNVFITDNFHGSNSWDELGVPPLDRPLCIKDEVHIGKNVWIGRNVCIMPGVKIGDGSVIGANAVVTHDIPAGCIAAGVPAVVIREME